MSVQRLRLRLGITDNDFLSHRKPALPCLGDAQVEVKDLVRVSDDVLQELIDLDAKVLLPRDATQKQIDACDDGSITTTNLKILALKAFAEAYIATKCLESEEEDSASTKSAAATRTPRRGVRLPEA